MLSRLRKELFLKKQNKQVRSGLRKTNPGELYVCLTLFLVGLSVFLIHCFTWVLPEWTSLQNCLETSCTVLDTRIVEQQDGENRRFRPEVRISFPYAKGIHVLWTLDAETLTAENGFVPDRNQAKKRLEKYVIGEKYPCWYAKNEPECAVLESHLSLWGWYFLAFPLCLIVIGLTGLFWAVQPVSLSEERKAVYAQRRFFFPTTSSKMESSGSNTHHFPTVPDSGSINDSPGTTLTFRLPIVRQKPLRLFVLTCFTAAWNVLSWSLLLWSLYQTQGLWSNFFLSMTFGILFCGFGLFLFIWMLHHFLIAFGIGPTILEISDHPVYPGRRYRLLLMQVGAFRYRRCELRIVCEEVARFRQGTDTMTSRKEVYSQTLFLREDFETSRDEILRKELFLRLPIGAMHSCVTEHNEIVWKIVLHAQLIGWSDLYGECPIILNPPTITDRSYDLTCF